MGRSNFKRQSHTPLIVWYDEDFMVFSDEIEAWVETKNEDMLYYNLSLIDGHYEGVQLNVELEYQDEFNCDSDEDVAYFYGCTVEELKRRLKEEHKQLTEFINFLKSEYLAIELKVVGTFSNGETVYEEV